MTFIQFIYIQKYFINLKFSKKKLLIYTIISILLNIFIPVLNAQPDFSMKYSAADIEQKSGYALYKAEINKRFKGGEWEKDLTKLSERALLQEYIRMVGISNHLTAMNIEKKEKIEALLAVYTAMQLRNKIKLLKESQ